MRDNAFDQLDGRSVDFLVITALPVERDALLRILASPAKLQPNGCPTYYFSTVPAYGRGGSYCAAVTMLNQMGNVEAARHAAQAISDLNPAYVLMVGIAGGVSGRIRLGDVVVATEILYYEVAKQYPEGPQRRPRVYPVDPVLLDRTKNYNDTTWQDLVLVERPDGKAIDTPRVSFGPIAAGEKVVADSGFVSDLIGSIPKLVGIEMESYGVATAAAHSAERPRFLAIRGICDFADSSKSDDWQEYAAGCAAAFTIGFLRSGPVRPSVMQPPKLVGEVDKRRSVIAIRHQSMEPIPASLIRTSMAAEFGDVDIEELVIDQTDLYINGRLVDPVEAVRRQEDLAQRVSELQLSRPGAELAYCGIAHIPLVFRAGYQLSNKSSIYLFEHDRQTAQWHRLQGVDRGPNLGLEEVLPAASSAPGEVILRVSVSYEVTLEDVQGLVPSAIASIHLRVPEPQIDLVTSEYQTREYSVRFRRILDTIHSRFSNVNSIHIFYAGPAALAFNFGRQISKTIHPTITVYNYFSKDVPKYSWGLDITSDSGLEKSLVRPKGAERS
jgi:nucleoside phosphorylase